MSIGTVDRIEAALAELTREDIAALPPARRRRLQSTLGSWECLCDDILHPGQPKAVRPVARGGEHAVAAYDPGSYEGRHGFAPNTLNAIYKGDQK
jgi:hypothetical protein